MWLPMLSVAIWIITDSQIDLLVNFIIVSATYQPTSAPAALATAIRAAETANRRAILVGIKRRGAPTQYATVKIDS